MTSPMSRALGALAAVCCILLTTAPAAAQSELERLRQRAPEDEIIYFVLPDRFANGDPTNDRGDLDGDRLTHGFDPAHKGFYHGGDLAGLTAKLDYIADLGATAIWLGPIYKNKPVQGAPGQESAGYHGYWITDFTSVDPHFGGQDDLKAFVEAAHDRGMKIYLDIITNHTADVIAYRECHDPDYQGDDRPAEGCPYRSKADYPYTTRGGPGGAAINEDFVGDGVATEENFSRLERADYAYTPYTPAGETAIKKPDWLNNPRLYHNRGDSTFEGESSEYGDFAGLDDLMTENPEVVEGFIDIFERWILEYEIDGFRVDTAKHVNPEFWRAFIPAVRDYAGNLGIEKFYVFGESYLLEPAALAVNVRESGFPAALDFPLYAAIRAVFAENAPTRILEDRYKADILFDGGAATARALPVFNGNHDAGRFAGFALKANPDISDTELYRRTRLAYALLYYGRGAPVIYSGDEQGFTGDGGDQDAREDMFASQVASYNDNRLIGGGTTATENYDRDGRLFRSLRGMGDIVKRHAAFRRGEQIIRLSEARPNGVFAFSRFDPETGAEYLVAMNTGPEKRAINVEVEAASRTWRSVIGACAAQSSAPQSYALALEPFDYIICEATR